MVPVNDRGVFVSKALGVFIFLLSLTASAIDTESTGYKVLNGTTVTINPSHSSSCRQVTNNGTKPHFVSTKTAAEWANFLAHVPSDLSVASCGGGYFVLTQTTYNGNLGGISGADAKCLTELQTYNFMGKGSATIDAAHVKAFICDESANAGSGGVCNNLTASTTYYFAVANSPTIGGASFVTDATGRGPGNSGTGTNWDVSNSYFGTANANALWWAGRTTSSPGTASLWPNVADNVHCSNWTTSTSTTGGNTTGKGLAGALNATNANRWGDGYYGCANTYRLICLANP